MIMQPMASDAPLIVYIDFKSPYAYLAIEPTRQMLYRSGIVADWRPFILDIGSYLGTAKLDSKGEVKEHKRSAEQWSGVKYAYFDCRRYANLRQLTVRGTVKIWNTQLPALGMFWIKQQESLAQQCQPGSLLSCYIDAIYKPFWKRELDVEQLDIIEQIIQQIGADSTGFRTYACGEGQDFNAEFQDATFAAGVYGVPTYVVTEPSDRTPHVFFGREHLPRVAWHLSGKQGPAPEIAYESHDQKLCGPTMPESLTVCIDFKSPSAYLALAPTLAWAQKTAVELDWRIITTPALKSPMALEATAARSELHRQFRAKYMAMDLQRYAPHELIDLYDTHRTDAAAIGLLWAIDQQANASGYITETFTTYWQQQRSIDTLADIKTILEKLGIDTAGFESFAATVGGQRAAEVREALSRKGITTSPTYLLNDEPFQGRQHLPLLASHFTDGVIDTPAGAKQSP
jgi:2-hydroxychromene-2-carboxylate isomerase